MDLENLTKKDLNLMRLLNNDNAFRLYRNFVNKHMALNKVASSQIAKIDIQLERNKRLSLLK